MASLSALAATPGSRTEVEAFVYSGWLALHETPYGPPEKPANRKQGWPAWTLTHLPTSGYIAQFMHQRFAKKCAVELADTIGPFETAPGEDVLRTIVGICARWLAIEAEELANG